MITCSNIFHRNDNFFFSSDHNQKVLEKKKFSHLYDFLSNNNIDDNQQISKKRRKTKIKSNEVVMKDNQYEKKGIDNKCWSFVNISHYQDKIFDILFYSTLLEKTDQPQAFYPLDYCVPNHLIDTCKEIFIHTKTKLKSENIFNLIDVDRKLSTLEKEYIKLVHYIPIVDLDMITKITLNKVKTNISNLTWFCVGYSKEKNIIINNGGFEMNVHEEYNRCENLYTSKKFDANCRGDRILVEYEDIGTLKDLSYNEEGNRILWVSIQKNGKKIGYRDINKKRYIYIITTIGQLNFFLWVMSTGIFDYVEEHVEEIKNHEFYIKNDAQKNSTKKRRRLVDKEEPKHTLIMKKGQY